MPALSPFTPISSDHSSFSRHIATERLMMHWIFTSPHYDDANDITMPSCHFSTAYRRRIYLTIIAAERRAATPPIAALFDWGLAFRRALFDKSLH
jgi:hypothetical protein